MECLEDKIEIFLIKYSKMKKLRWKINEPDRETENSESPKPEWYKTQKTSKNTEMKLLKK